MTENFQIHGLTWSLSNKKTSGRIHANSWGQTEQTIWGNLIIAGSLEGTACMSGVRDSWGWAWCPVKSCFFLNQTLLVFLALPSIAWHCLLQASFPRFAFCLEWLFINWHDRLGFWPIRFSPQQLCSLRQNNKISLLGHLWVPTTSYFTHQDGPHDAQDSSWSFDVTTCSIRQTLGFLLISVQILTLLVWSMLYLRRFFQTPEPFDPE